MVDFNKKPIELSQGIINLYLKLGTIRRINGKLISVEEDEIVVEKKEKEQ